MIKKLLAIFAIVLVCLISKARAQETNYLQSFLIDSSLTKDANAIVRSEEIVVEINSVTSVTVQTKRIVTVLNKTGNRYTHAYEFYEPEMKIKKLEATIYNKLGQKIKRYKKSDFADRSYADGISIAIDSRYKYINYTPTEYPYTIVFESEISNSSSAFLKGWSPISGYNLSIEKSKYKIINPLQIPLRYKENNFDHYSINVNNNDFEVDYTITEQPALTEEYLSPSFEDLVPNVLVSLSKFNLVGVKGNATDWNSFGKWQYQNLVSNRNNLPDETKQKISDLVADAGSDLEKAKRIYKYVQDKTRYVSIQLGIGGWMPMHATDVDKLGYGDCKALTNYTKALLDSQNILSYYTVVYGDRTKKNIDAEFASMQGNHVILNIPDGEQEIWLECTSQTTPFNFIGDFTDDRDVLVIKPEGGEIKRTKKYTPEESIMHTKATIEVKIDQSIDADIEIRSQGIQYSWQYRTQFKSPKDQKLYYKEHWDYINSLSIDRIDLKDNKDEISFEENITVSARNYTKKVGSRLLLKPNFFNRDGYKLPKYDNRKYDLIISRGYIDKDEYEISIPQGYQYGNLPATMVIENKFGRYTCSFVSIDKHKIWYKRTLQINDGVFPKEDYEAYRTFRTTINKTDNKKIILTQNK